MGWRGGVGGKRWFPAHRSPCCRPSSSYTAPPLPHPFLLHPPAARAAIGGRVWGWRERFCRASSRPSSSLSHGRACHCGGEGEAVVEASQASAAAARCYRGTSNCRPCLHLLFLLLSAAVERQVLPLSPAVPPPLAATRSCSPGGLPPHAPASAASTLAEGLLQLNMPPLH
ncbi:unnamed protein product [Closterium sp. NIES-54]